MPHKPDLVLQSVARDQSGKLLAVAGPARRVSGENDNGSIERAFTVQEGGGLDGLPVSLQSREARGLEHDLGFRRHAPTLLEPGHRPRLNRARVEHALIDAAIDGADPLPRGL